MDSAHRETVSPHVFNHLSQEWVTHLGSDDFPQGIGAPSRQFLKDIPYENTDDIFDPVLNIFRKIPEIKFFRGGREVGVEASSALGDSANRLSATNWIDCHYLIVRVGHLDPTKNACHAA